MGNSSRELDRRLRLDRKMSAVLPEEYSMRARLFVVEESVVVGARKPTRSAYV